MIYNHITDEMFTQAYNHAIRLAERMAHDGQDPEALRDAALDALVEAADTYTPDCGTTFSTWAHARCRGAILDTICHRQRLVRSSRPDDEQQYDTDDLPRAAQATADTWDEEEQEATTTQAPDTDRQALLDQVNQALATLDDLEYEVLMEAARQSKMAENQRCSTPYTLNRRGWNQLARHFALPLQLVKTLHDQALRKVRQHMGLTPVPQPASAPDGLLALLPVWL